MLAKSDYRVRFRVLGPVEAQADGGDLVLLPSKPRTMLAVLLLEAGRRLRQDRLESALWPRQVPASAPQVIRTYMSQLRRSLSLTRRDLLPRLAVASGGYRLEVAPGDLDMLVFHDLAARGRQALTGGDATSAVRLLDQALRLWRGDAAEDVTVDEETDAVRIRLTEQRLLTEEDRADAALTLGGDAELIPRLQLLVGSHPLRERLRGQLMTAYCQAGHQTAALATYQQLRTHLVTELGTEPCVALRELHERVLAGDLLAASRRTAVTLVAPVPRQLPPDVSHFAGRAAELDLLDGLLGSYQPGAAPPSTAPPGTGAIAVIGGTAGVGKTALAIRWAHRAARRFPDGQLYTSLQAYESGVARPADPLEVLGGFLRALGVPPAHVPGDQDEAAAMYRSLFHGKRILVVLDNAVSSEQVRPLLPRASGCAVVVTSRGCLAGFGARDDVGQVGLSPLRPAEAVDLLRTLLGTERADAESPALATISAECACLPLALRIAAERAIARPHQSLALLAAHLRSARDRLDLLTADRDPASSARAVVSWSYRALPQETARMFRLLGLHPGSDISVPAAAALAGCDARPAARILQALADAHLIEETAPDRYRFHDLLRAYAAGRADLDEAAADRYGAIRRCLAWYLHTADAADRVLGPAAQRVPLDPPPTGCHPMAIADYWQALMWFDAEYSNLVAAIGSAASNGENETAWKMTAALASYGQVRRLWATHISCEQDTSNRLCGDVRFTSTSTSA